MTTPSPPGLPVRPSPSWTGGRTGTDGPCWQRYVPGKGILRVTRTSGSAGRYDWHLTVTGTEAIAWGPPGRYARPRDARRAADRFADRMPTGLFEPITSPGDAARLYMTLERARDLGYPPGAADWYLDRARGELLTHIRILALDPAYRGPAPDQVIREAALWRAAAAKTGLADSDFDPAVLGADRWERGHLRAATVFVLTGDYSEASTELDLATTVAAPGSDTESLIGRLRTRLDEETAGPRSEDRPRTSMTGITTRRLRQELRDLGVIPVRIEELIEATPYMESRQGWSGSADFTLTAAGSAVGPRRWDLQVRPPGTGHDPPGGPATPASRTAGEATPAVNIVTGEYAVVVDRSPQDGTVQVRHPDGSHGWGNASAFAPAVTVLDPALNTAIELARDLGITPPAGPGHLRVGSSYAAWCAIVRAAGLDMASPAARAAAAAAYKATGLDPAYSPVRSVPWARAAWQALRAELSTPGRHTGDHPAVLALGEGAAPGLAGGPDFPSGPAARQGANPARRAAGTGIASPARQARPGRPGLAYQEPAMTTPPAPPGWADEPEPGWSPATIPPYGPGYSRDVPGKGMLQVWYENGQYHWSLQTDPADARPGQGGFARGRAAMRAADRWVRTARIPGQANTSSPISRASRGAGPVGRRGPRRTGGRGR